ncbi:hypothetical protein COOONC_25915 [Cooperia oncophora]
MRSTRSDEGDDPYPQIDGAKGLVKNFGRLLNNTCLCSRYNDPSTTKVAIWMPIANYTSESYTDLLTTPYVHYVVPFYQPYVSSLNIISIFLISVSHFLNALLYWPYGMRSQN